MASYDRPMPKSPDAPPATLADEIRAGFDITAICLERSHASVLSSRALAVRLGEGFPVRHLLERLRCHQCRSKNVDVLVHQPMRADAGLHADHARRHIGKAYFHLATRPLLTQHNRAALIVANNVKRVLADIDP